MIILAANNNLAICTLREREREGETGLGSWQHIEQTEDPFSSKMSN
jgi:hypothetical protein